MTEETKVAELIEALEAADSLFFDLITRAGYHRINDANEAKIRALRAALAKAKGGQS